MERGRYVLLVVEVDRTYGRKADGAMDAPGRGCLPCRTSDRAVTTIAQIRAVTG